MRYASRWRVREVTIPMIFPSALQKKYRAGWRVWEAGPWRRSRISSRRSLWPQESSRPLRASSSSATRVRSGGRRGRGYWSISAISPWSRCWQGYSMISRRMATRSRSLLISSYPSRSQACLRKRRRRRSSGPRWS